MAFLDVPGVVVPSLKLGTNANSDEITQNTNNINSALADANNKVVLLPAGVIYCNNTISMPYGVELRGAAFCPLLPDGQGAIVPASPPPTVLVFPTTVSPCITMGNGTANIPGALTNIHISRLQTTIQSPAWTGTGIYVHGGYNIRIENVMVSRQAIGYYFKNTPSNGGVGISAKINGIYSSAITDTHILMDTWPELYISGGRLGQNGGTDLACNSYVRVTGGSGNGAQGPNSLIVNQVQFNQGFSKPKYWLEFSSLINSDSNALEYKFDNCHIEGVGYAFIKSDFATESITQLNITNCTFNEPSIPFFDLSTATTLNDCSIHSCHIFTSNFNLQPNNQINNLSVCNSLLSPMSAPASPPSLVMQLIVPANSTVTFSDTCFGGNVKIGGAGNVSFTNPSFKKGAFVFDTNVPRTGKMFVSNLGYEVIDIIGIAIGTSTNVTYGYRTASWQFSGNKINVDFRISITNKNNLTGPVAVTNLPVPFDLNHGGQAAGGGIVTLVDNVSGLTSPIILSPKKDSGNQATQMGLWMSTATGLTQVTGANLNPSISSPTRIFGHFSYTF
ncbi:hypothetical protein Q4610_07920 [Sphingobium sp. HBC34]|uniref:Pectate lyase superfamily protein domain-containing protein n=1 Tax=Sphingobium cyanobacteriorum TaxID=3063954 RepID=A0ABT8ZKA3_9SPHN|nr:hypothetical protein [Sphingobium sp. HBC34]MDO7834974.1 hypothetical protein [Sphingobium sp. HBC34]